MVADLSRLAQPSGYYLVEDPSVVTYYLGSKVQFSHVDSTYTSFNYVDPQTHKMLFSFPAFADSIKRGYFSDIVLAFGDTFGQDQAIMQDISQDHNYRLIDTIPYQTSYGSGNYVIWQRIPPASHARRAPQARGAPAPQALTALGIPGPRCSRWHGSRGAFSGTAPASR